MSADGRFVVFDSRIANLIYGDTNNANDVFLRDRQTGELRRVSVASDGSQGNADSGFSKISKNGRHIAFWSCATNFDPADTNGRCDLFIHDRETGTTVLGNLGPDGELPTSTTQHYFKLNADGRYLVFLASYGGGYNDHKVYLRDRDTDQNGVFDEAGGVSTTLISQQWVANNETYGFEDVAISGDGRWIAYSAAANRLDEFSYEYIGTRLYLYDRQTGNHGRVDLAMAGGVDTVAYSGGPDFSDANHLAYYSNADNLAEGDTDGQPDVYVFNTITGGNQPIELSHPGAPVLEYEWGAVISADGRYVAFTGVNYDEWWQQLSNAYVVDRQTGQSYAISVRPDGLPDNEAWAAAISADGSQISINASANMLPYNWGPKGIYVVGGVALSPVEIDVPPDGGQFDIDVTVPAGVRWELQSYDPYLELSQISGVGSATVQATLYENTTGEDREFYVMLGSEQVTLRQTSRPAIYGALPWSGPTTGGIEVGVYGSGFVEGMTVEFGGVPATNVTFISSDQLRVTIPANPSGWVHIKVTRPDGIFQELVYAFLYGDTTPPTVTAQVTGTPGTNGWYTSDVTVTWIIEDGESEITSGPCPPVTITTDTPSTQLSCYAESEGGSTFQSVDLKRDATPPVPTLYNPVDLNDIIQYWEYWLDFACADSMSGVASCGTSQGTMLDTSAIGTFQVVVIAQDQAGLTANAVYNYTVKRSVGLYSPNVPSVWGSPANLTVWALTGGGGYPSAPLAGATISFIVDNVVAGTAVTDASGWATLAVPGLEVGSHSVRFDYAGSTENRYMWRDYTHVVTKATPIVTWANPSFILPTTPLGSTELNATASVPGSFVYTPGFWATLPAGTHTLSVQFTPQDTAHYEAVTKTVTLKVKAIPVVTWPTPAAITYPTVLGAAQLNATANTAGSFVYNWPAGTLLDAGTHTLYVTFNPSNTADYVSESTTTTIEVLKGTVTINWPPYINPFFYGSQLTGLQLNAAASAPGLLTYSPPSGTILNAGTHTLAVSYDPGWPNNYHPATATVDLLVRKAYPVVNWPGTLAPIVYGTPLGAAQLYATSSYAGTITYDPPAGTLLEYGLRTITMTFTPDDTANYNTITQQKTIAVDKQTTTVSWNNLAPIVYGTALGAAQLNATGSQPGTFTYDPPAGTVLNAGTHTLSVYFNPTNTNYYGGSWTTTLVVAKRAPVITWSNPGGITYGAALSALQLNASSNIAGTFSYSPALGTVLPAGAHTLSVTFTPADTANNLPASASVSINVAAATPVVTWSNPAGITYGTALSAAQLNATANVPGTFAYSPAAGEVLNAGSHALSVTFTPADAANYNAVSANTSIAVAAATPAVTWSNPAGITYGSALSAAQLNATANVAGTFSYSPADGAVLNAGSHTLAVTFTPDDAANYTSATRSVSINVAKATPIVTWPNPAGIIYGTALSATQLNATASVPGTFAYLPAAGAVLNAGSRTLSVTFTPDDASNYTIATGSATIDVGQAEPIVTWADPAGLTYGNNLTSAQLNATANVPGTFVYSPPHSTILNAGTHQLSVTFTPTDAANYAAATANVTLIVAKATPAVSFSTSSAIVYGTALGSSQLNAAANRPGTFTFAPPAGTVLNAGTHELSVTFAPDDSTNYHSVVKTASLEVLKATPVLSWPAPAGINYGTPLSATQLNASANIPGTFVYSPAEGTVLGAGMKPLSVTFTPTDTANYDTGFQPRTITVAKVPLALAVNNTAKVYGQALPAFTLTGTGFVNGDSVSSLNGTMTFSTFATETSAPGVYAVWTNQGLSSPNYNITYTDGTLTVSKASTSVALTTTPSPSNNNQQVQLRAVVSAVAPGAGTPSGTVEFREGSTLLGTATLVNGVATMNKSFKRGAHPLTATYVASTNFNGSVGSITHQVN